MQLLLGVLMAAAVASWLVAAVSALLALQDRAPGLSIGTLMGQGHRFFDPDSFGEAGKVHQGRMLKAFGGFFVFLFLLFVLAVLSGNVVL